MVTVEWKLPKIIDPNNKKDAINKQLSRLQLIIDQWTNALKENKHTTIAMDDNLDSNPNAAHNKIYKIYKLVTLFNDHLESNGITTHNKKMTRYESNSPPSSLDHFYSNCPTNIDNVQTHTNIFSDHSIISLCYSSKLKIYQPKFIKVRNRKLLTKNRLEKFINQSIALNNIFTYADPELIANILHIKLNAIINLIAPSKNIQFKKDYQGYLSN